ncbi:hypothetical protein KM043_011263 [Ampulex compressa]|nr:hypothetical protein KM043_011263 [Ampulex compressa]
MQMVHLYGTFVWGVLSFLQGNVYGFHVKLTHDGPIVLGATITFRADLYDNNNNPPIGVFKYKWEDSVFRSHKYQTPSTSNTTTYWNVSYPSDVNSIGTYKVNVIVSEQIISFWWNDITSNWTSFEITEFLNGNITVEQSNKTEDLYVSSTSETKLTVDLYKGDHDYIIQKATTISTYWFIDCEHYGQTNDFSFVFNFTNPDASHVIGALVIASYEPPTTTTVLSPTTTTVPNATTVPIYTTNLPNRTVLNVNTSSIATGTTPLSTSDITTQIPTMASTIMPLTTEAILNKNITNSGNISLPYICFKPSIIPVDPNKTYGYFFKKVEVRAPIMNITVEGTNWIQPWDMLSLNVTCKGSEPFYKCLQYHRGKYNITGNETCNNADQLQLCNFSIIRYFLEPSVYTILVILNNDVSKQIYPLTINIYKVTKKPQLSVIVVPVSCTLAAIVLIVFGVAYYIQNRARFTIEVADFDFGQNNPDMEYKTFSERLRDSFNNAGYKPLSNPEALQ